MRYRTVLATAVGDPGLLSGIARGIGRVAGAVVGMTPIGRAVQTVLPTAGPGGRPTVPPVSRDPRYRPEPGMRGVVHRALPGGSTGYVKRPGRRMNPGNAKAARRAIRRIKSAMGMLKSIQQLLPHRPARKACPPGRKR